jgi:glucose-6-phosphate isomerase
VKGKIGKMFSGEHINVTEDRSVGPVADRPIV